MRAVRPAAVCRSCGSCIRTLLWARFMTAEELVWAHAAGVATLGHFAKKASTVAKAHSVPSTSNALVIVVGCGICCVRIMQAPFLAGDCEAFFFVVFEEVCAPTRRRGRRRDSAANTQARTRCRLSCTWTGVERSSPNLALCCLYSWKNRTKWFRSRYGFETGANQNFNFSPTLCRP